MTDIQLSKEETGGRNGRYVAFESIATNLGPVSSGVQVFYVDRQGGPVTPSASLLLP